MKKLIALAVLSLVLPAFYSGCLGDSHMEPSATTEPPPPEGTPIGEEMPADSAVPAELTLTIQSITGTGSVSVEYGDTPVEACVTAPCTYTITKDTLVTLTGAGTGGQVFSRWDGSLTDSVNPKTFTIEENMTIDAKFMAPIERIEKPIIDRDRLTEPRPDVVPRP